MSAPDRLITALADRYTIERELGAGGMATVYLARDLKHDRDVAIKVLRPELAAVIGADRFLTEIKTTANLQHPHILPLFDSGTAGDDEGRGMPRPYLFYVMPFIEGETLRDRLDREKQLPIGEAVRIASEVASALDYAHRRGVIHRDIKPENILLHEGQALVADFGIALAASRAGGSRMTETGMSLGTPHYMSPEQAMGEREISARSDVYALGCVTYEMLIGDPPFTGSTAQAIVAKVLTEKPSGLSRTRSTISEAVEDAVLTALEKLPADRFATAAEFAAALAGGTTARATTRSAARPVAPSPGQRRGYVVAGVTLAALCLAGGWLLGRRGGTTASAGPAVYDVATPDSARVSFINTSSSYATYGAVGRTVSIAPTGDFAVYVALQPDSVALLWYRSLLTDDTRPFPGTTGASVPRVSPDGTQVAYFAGNQVMVVSVAGGEPRPLATLLDGRMLDWISADQLLALGSDGDRALWIKLGGGEPRERSIVRCPLGTWAPSMKELLCGFNGAARMIDLETDSTYEVRTLQGDGTPGGPLAGSEFRIIDERYLVFISPDGVLTGANFDPETRLVQRAVPLVPGIRRESIGEAHFDVSENGTLVYAPGLDVTKGRLVRRISNAAPVPLPIEGAHFQRYDLSRDGRWLAAVVQGNSLNELRIYDLRTGQHTVWQRAEIIRHPMWSPDGQSILYAARAGDQWSLLRGTPGAGTPTDTLARYAATGVTFDALGYPNDSTAIAQEWLGALVVRFDPRRASATMDTVLRGARFPSVSATGQLVAYQSMDGSRIMVTTFPAAGRRWQIASQGVEPLMLSPRTVLFRQGASWYTATVNPTTGEPSGAPVQWANDPRFSDTSGWSNVPTHDGGIIYVQGPEQASPGYFRVIPNWVREMKRAVDQAAK
ncbi:MAG: serine/threonine-protein kinase [Gemmatimonadetes bacterium]|nr:serine/threonine-protein kinase [Gemmatimonadota bacterium]